MMSALWDGTIDTHDPVVLINFDDLDSQSEKVLEEVENKAAKIMYTCLMTLSYSDRITYLFLNTQRLTTRSKQAVFLSEPQQQSYE